MTKHKLKVHTHTGYKLLFEFGVCCELVSFLSAKWLEQQKRSRRRRVGRIANSSASNIGGKQSKK